MRNYILLKLFHNSFLLFILLFTIFLNLFLKFFFLIFRNTKIDSNCLGLACYHVFLVLSFNVTLIEFVNANVDFLKHLFVFNVLVDGIEINTGTLVFGDHF